MKHILLATLAALSLVACNGNNDNNATASDGSSGGNKGGTDANGTLFVNKSQTSINIKEPNNILGLWETDAMAEVNGNVIFKIRVKFTPNLVINASECSFVDGVKLYAQVSAQVSYHDDGVEILQPAEKEQKLDKNGTNYSCSATLEPGFQVTNIFNGKMYDSKGNVMTKIAD